MGLWNKKKTNNKIIEYFINKGITYEAIEEDEKRIKIEFCFPNKNFILYPYITIDKELISVNINVSKPNIKNFNYSLINNFNMKANYFKAYIANDGIIVLEYCFIADDFIENVFDNLTSELFSLADDIDLL